MSLHSSIAKSYISRQKLRSIAVRVSSLKLANAKTLAKNIREEIYKQILSMFPAGTWEKSGMYDTNDEGKGWKEGYVSFGMKPTAFASGGLIGGILFRFQYSSGTVAPKAGTPEHDAWNRGGGLGFQGTVAEVGTLSGGYYNKLLGGSVESFSESAVDVEKGASKHTGDKDVLFGEASFEVSSTETVMDWQWSDSSKVIQEVQKIINGIVTSKPDGTSSTDQVKINRMNPYTSVKKFINLLIKERRNEVYMEEVQLVAKSMDTVPNTIIPILKNRGFVVLNTPAPFVLKDKRV